MTSSSRWTCSGNTDGSNVIGKAGGGQEAGQKAASCGAGFSYGGVVRKQSGRQVLRRARRRRAMRRVGDRIRRRTMRPRMDTVVGRIRVGTAGASPRLRRWVLAAVLLGVALLPYPSLGSVSVVPAAACRSGCRAGSVPSMIKWTRPLPGSWQVVPGLTGTVPTSGLAYVSVGYGVAAVGVGLTVSGYSAKTGAPLWDQTLTGFPAGAAIVSVRTWPGEVTAGVSYPGAGHQERIEVVISGSTGVPSGRYPAALFGGAVAGSSRYTVIVGPTAVTSYDNATGRVRWRLATGPVPQAWRTDDGKLYMAESAGGFLGSAPVTALRQINLATGAQILVRPLEGLSFTGTFSAAFAGVVLFSTAGGVTAYDGTTGAWLWSLGGARGYRPAETADLPDQGSQPHRGEPAHRPRHRDGVRVGGYRVGGPVRGAGRRGARAGPRSERRRLGLQHRRAARHAGRRRAGLAALLRRPQRHRRQRRPGQ